MDREMEDYRQSEGGWKWWRNRTRRQMQDRWDGSGGISRQRVRKGMETELELGKGKERASEREGKRRIRIRMEMDWKGLLRDNGLVAVSYCYRMYL
jgi:hypothetical protein